MDNITHSVVGLGIGALIDRSLPPEPDTARERTRQRMLLTVGCLASNFPDLDLVYTRILPAPLGYLLHHRGHTHTLLAALGEVLVLLALVWLLWPNARRLLQVSATARWGAVIAACAGLLLHLSMDGMNVYGVHPFWPWNTHWYYGDLVFIVEPVFWFAFGAPLAAIVPRPRLRWLFLGLMVLIPVVATLLGFLQWGSLAALVAIGLVLAWVTRHAHERHGARGRLALAAGLAVSLAFIGVQAVALQQARSVLAAAVRTLDPGERLLDTALSAYPANPLCWSFVTVARDDAGGSYHLRRGLLSVAPGIDPVRACPAPIAGRASEDATPQLAWLGDRRESLAELQSLARDCHVNAWLRFARAPSIAGGLATDVRWGPVGSTNFSTMEIAAQADTPCPHPVPDWTYPRADLLGSAH
ncbi:metal-dependent hydrolase [Herbaspirillum sp. SJZ107]|uniref:metal-dependent hydrolase n=1 Tax=Herbaspirillum sp. SJZ107 TaxID=2572881 RepID=UPI0011549D04|nr:metal-dependent hydrolase [Herbaspirillum sp. SJZ107]TQK03170.1 inner membrane protein [Herbaspirillum sp. SJZ107]